MSASGSTPHLHLSQYNGTDHPSYVSDYTEDMGRIDTGFNLAQTNALNALNRVAALEQSIGSAGVVGQTAVLSTNSNVDAGMVEGGLLVLGFRPPMVTWTRNAEPADVPWTWGNSGTSMVDTVGPVFADRGVYRVTVAAVATYQPSPNISSAYIHLWTGQDDHCVPLVHVDDGLDGRRYGAAGSFVVPYDGGDVGITFQTSFGDSSVPDAQVLWSLTVDVAQLSTENSKQSFPGQP